MMLLVLLLRKADATEVVEIGTLCESPCCDDELLYRIYSILDPLFGPRIDPDDINQDDMRELRRQQQLERVDISCVPLGVLTVCGGHFILFVFKMRNNIQFFIKSPDGTFEYFCPYFFLMLHLFSVNDIMNHPNKSICFFWGLFLVSFFDRLFVILRVFQKDFANIVQVKIKIDMEVVSYLHLFNKISMCLI